MKFRKKSIIIRTIDKLQFFGWELRFWFETNGSQAAGRPAVHRRDAGSIFLEVLKNFVLSIASLILKLEEKKCLPQVVPSKTRL